MASSFFKTEAAISLQKSVLSSPVRTEALVLDLVSKSGEPLAFFAKIIREGKKVSLGSAIWGLCDLLPPRRCDCSAASIYPRLRYRPSPSLVEGANTNEASAPDFVTSSASCRITTYFC